MHTQQPAQHDEKKEEQRVKRSRKRQINNKQIKGKNEWKNLQLVVIVCDEEKNSFRLLLRP